MHKYDIYDIHEMTADKLYEKGLCSCDECAEVLSLDIVRHYEDEKYCELCYDKVVVENELAIDHGE